MRTETATERIAELERWFSLICREVYPQRDCVTTNGEFVAEEVKRLRERNVKLAQENKALKVDFAWLDAHVVRVSDKDDKLIFFRAPSASAIRSYIAEARGEISREE